MMPLGDEYLNKFIDILVDDYDCPEDVDFLTDIPKFDENCVLDINIITQRVSINSKSKIIKNVITPKRCIIKHNFLKGPILMIYTSLNSHRKYLRYVLENFYDYFYNCILSSVIEIKSPPVAVKEYINEIPIVYYQDYKSLSLSLFSSADDSS